MPELVEVETFRRQLSPLLVGKTILEFSASHIRSIRRHDSQVSIKSRIENHEIISLKRHGKYLAIVFDTGDHLNMHLRMSGRFLSFDKSNYSTDLDPKHTHIHIETNENMILFIDPRTFGEMWVTSGTADEVKKGLDAFSSTISEREKVIDRLGVSKRTVKAVLLDQNIFSGIGNIYADEICAEARIQPTRPICSLTKGERLRLNESFSKVLSKAIASRGSSLRDESFKDLFGEIGKYQLEHVVHARDTCAHCGGEITKVKVAGRTTYFCENCQK